MNDRRRVGCCASTAPLPMRKVIHFLDLVSLFMFIKARYVSVLLIYFPQDDLVHASEGEAEVIKSSGSFNTTAAANPSSLHF